MARHTRRTAVSDYLESYPDIAQRWINRCGLCDRVGYKPEMSDEARGAHYLKRELEPLTLDISVDATFAQQPQRASAIETPSPP